MVSGLLEVKQLQTRFDTDDGQIAVVEQVSFTLGKGEIVALVGESGCGKSVTSLSIMGLLGKQGRVTGGEIWLDGRNLLDMGKKELRGVRGHEISMIFQEPMTSLNPVFTLGSQIAESLRTHLKLSRQEAREKSVALLEQVGIPNPRAAARFYPHQLSGGMRQRVMIAMALSCQPKVLIADEPTTALDVTIQAQILELIMKLSKSKEMSVLLITHDLAVVAETADKVIVMYAGYVVEEAPVSALFSSPTHPYTEGLLRSLRSLEEEGDALHVIPGSVPNPARRPAGCAFHPRCPYARERCRTEMPDRRLIADNHAIRCFFPFGKESS